MSSVNPRDRYAGWLPPPSRATNPYWFPLHQSSFPAVIAAVAQSPGRAVPLAIVDALRDDSLLLAYTAIAWLQDKRSPKHHTSDGIEPAEPARCENRDAGDLSTVTLAELGQWWVGHGQHVLAACNPLQLPPSEAIDWNRLAHLEGYFATLPLQRRLASASLWLDALGVQITPQLRDTLTGLTLTDDVGRHTIDRQSNGTGGEIARSNLDLLVAVAKRAGHVDRMESAASSQIETTRRSLAKQIAYGLSHEINNPLANIATRAQSLQERLRQASGVWQPGESGKLIQASLQRIVDQAYRAHAMIADLMFYANPPAPHRQRFDLLERIGRVIEGAKLEAERLQIEVRGPNPASVCLTEQQPGRCIHPDGVTSGQAPDDSTAARMSAANQDAAANLDAKTFVCYGDPDMVGDAVAACLQNALDAIGRQGRIAIDVHLEGDEFVVRVSDSGPGLTVEAAGQAFDPYFSGREAGRGLGLGLCRAERIVELHAGTIRLHPALAGCVAEIRLPRWSPGEADIEKV